MNRQRKKFFTWLLSAALIFMVLPAAPVFAETEAFTGAEETSAAVSAPETTEATLLSDQEANQEGVAGTFVLVGDSAHGNGAHTGFVKWLEVPYTAQKGDTVYQVFERALQEGGFTFTAQDSGYGKFIDSVTSPSGVTLASGTNAQYSGWMYYVNNISPMDSADSYVVQDGDRIQFLYVDDFSSDSRIDENYNITMETDLVLPDYSSEWSSFGKNSFNNGVISAQTARTASEASLKWTAGLKAVSDWATNISEPLLVNNQIYIAAGDKLKVLDSAGQIIKEGQLAEKIGFTTRMAYSNGKILVPIEGGAIQALAADTLKTVWISEGVPAGAQGSHQSLTPITCSGGMVYMGTAVADWSSSYEGVFLALDENTGKTVWTYENQQAGYYWSGASVVNNTVIFAGDDGVLTALNAADGAVQAQMDLESGVRGTVAVDQGMAYVASKDGRLHQIELKEDGTFGAHRSVSFAAYSTGTPAAAGGKVFVGGSRADYTGVLAVIDRDSMEVVQTVSADAEVKSAPLVSTGYDGQSFVYYTVNKNPGAVYVLNAGSGKSEALYTPEEALQNYCIASVIGDGAGVLYYTNDSGALFAVEKVPGEESPTAGTESAGETEESPEVSTESAGAGDRESSAEQEFSSEAMGDSPATGDSGVPGGVILSMALACAGLLAAVGTKGRRLKNN